MSAASPGRPRRITTLTWVVVALVAIRLVAVVLVVSSGVEQENSVLGGDARRYEDIVGGDGTPYRDFDVEYPPVTLGLMHVVKGSTLLGTLTRLAISQLVLELGTALALAWGLGRRAGVAYLVIGTPMAFFPFPYLRTDLLAVFLAVLGVALVRRGMQRSGGSTLAIAAFAKVWPVVVAPILVVERRWRGFVAWAVTGAAGVTAWVAWAGTGGITETLTFRGAKGWQIESLPGAVIHLLDPDGSAMEQGAWRTSVVVPGAVRVALTLASLAVTFSAWWWASRRRAEGADDTVSYAYAPLAAVLSLLVFATIISPQYLLWMVPFAAVAAARRDRLVGGLALAITATTTYVLATIHAQIEARLHAMLPLIGRNVLLVVLLAVALARLARPAPSGGEGGRDWRPADDDVVATASPSA